MCLAEPMVIDKFCADGKATPAFGSVRGVVSSHV